MGLAGAIGDAIVKGFDKTATPLSSDAIKQAAATDASQAAQTLSTEAGKLEKDGLQISTKAARALKAKAPVVAAQAKAEAQTLSDAAVKGFEGTPAAKLALDVTPQKVEAVAETAAGSLGKAARQAENKGIELVNETIAGAEKAAPYVKADARTMSADLQAQLQVGMAQVKAGLKGEARTALETHLLDLANRGEQPSKLLQDLAANHGIDLSALTQAARGQIDLPVENYLAMANGAISHFDFNAAHENFAKAVSAAGSAQDLGTIYNKAYQGFEHNAQMLDWYNVFQNAKNRSVFKSVAQDVAAKGPSVVQTTQEAVDLAKAIVTQSTYSYESNPLLSLKGVDKILAGRDQILMRGAALSPDKAGATAIGETLAQGDRVQAAQYAFEQAKLKAN